MRGRRPPAHEGPKTSESVGDPPAWLNTEALAEWHRVVKILVGMGCEPSALHRSLLIDYCVMQATIERTSQILDREGATLTTDKGSIIRHPAAVTLTQATAQSLRCQCELGLTPGSAGKIPRQTAEKKSKFADL